MSTPGVLTKPIQLQSASTPPKPRANVITMPEYHPPLASRDALRLDFNENTFAPSPRVIERMRALTAEDLTKYPERERVEQTVAAHFGLDADQVLLTNGVDEAIHLICCTFLEEGDEALVFTPGFFMYDVSIGLMTRNLRRVQADASLQFDLQRFLAAITPATKLIIVASPNNPTGAPVPRTDLLAIVEAAPHAVVFIDEAYFHFHGDTTLNDIANYPNLLVGRTFSKAYGLAHLRVGMVVGNRILMSYLRKVASPYNVNGVALAVLPEALADEAYVAWYVNQVRSGRERIMQRLTELRMPFFPSAANFILMKVGPLHNSLVEAMRRRGVLLRDRSTDPGCEGCVRITIGVDAQVEQGLQALAASLEEIEWKA